MRVLCSTGVFTRTSDPLSHAAILRYGSQFAADGADGFEVIYYPRWYAAQDEVASALRASALAFPVLHTEKSIGECFGGERNEQEQGISRYERNCAFARQIGARLVVLHLWGLPHSDTHLERNLRLLPRCLDIAEGYRLELAIETIPCTAANPLTNVRRVVERDARSRVALDTEFLALHGQLDAVFEADWLWQTTLVRHVHLKDFDGGPVAGTARRYLHPGDGQIDFARFLRRLRATGFDGALSLEARGLDAENNVEITRIHASLRLIADLARAV